MKAPEWTTACPDWEDRIREGRSLIPLAPIFPDQAEIGLQVFKSLRVVDVVHPDGLVDDDGRTIPPTVEEVCREWIIEIAAVLHGSYDVTTGQRLIREVLLKLPKKNWKSGFASTLMLSLMVLNWRSSNEAAVIAPSKDTADNVFKPMKDAIEADPELRALFHIQPNMRTVTHRVTGMSCRVYAADTDVVSGKKWAFVIFEELWLLAQRAGAVDMMLEATGGQASRPEGLVISITTESDGDPVGIYKAKLEYAQAVRDGKIHDPSFLPILYEWPKAMIKAKAYLDPANFHLVNPNYGASVDPEDMLRKYAEAQAAGGESLRVFLAKRLNVPPSEGTSGGWAGAAYWQQQGEPELTFESLLKRSEVVVVGIDGGGLDDLLGLALLGREKGTKTWLHWGHCWAHRIVLDRRKDIAPLLETFEKQGDLTIVDLPGDDITDLADRVEAVKHAGLLPEKMAIGVDAAGIGAILEELQGRGLTEDQFVAVSQGWKLNGAIKTAERALAGKTFVHCGQPVVGWAVQNAKVVAVGNAITINKQVSGSGKIDPLMAIFDAVSLMALNPAAKRKKLVMFTVGANGPQKGNQATAK